MQSVAGPRERGGEGSTLEAEGAFSAMHASRFLLRCCRPRPVLGVLRVRWSEPVRCMRCRKALREGASKPWLHP
eukprot:351935-Chlamydomonas_euryale.AAC.4